MPHASRPWHALSSACLMRWSHVLCTAQAVRQCARVPCPLKQRACSWCAMCIALPLARPRHPAVTRATSPLRLRSAQDDPLASLDKSAKGKRNPVIKTQNYKPQMPVCVGHAALPHGGWAPGQHP